MPQFTLYCPACGAANAPNDSACFACQQTLLIQIDENKHISLLQKRYQVLSQVGTGGFGAVYKAQDTKAQNRLVAIKQINLRGLTPQEVIEATDGFNREVQMLSTLSHAHLPRIHAHFTDPEHWYVVMDFIEGETLEHYLRDIGSARENAIRALALDEVLDIGLQLCDVLEYLHTRQPPIIFRDLKPANLMRTLRGQLYLIDFGTARSFKPGQTRDTIPLGSPGYAAPEQYGRAQTTPRADIYSLGALLHHLLSRHDPSETPFSFAPLRLPTFTGLRELAQLVARMVEQDSTKRPAEIAEVKAALLHIRNLRAAEPRIWWPAPGQAPPVLTPATSQPQQMQRHILNKPALPKKSRRGFLIGGLAVASSLALGGFSFWRYWHPSVVLEQGFPKQFPPTSSDVSTIAWSPDGQMLAFGFSDGSVTTGRFANTTSSAPLTETFSFKIDAPTQPISVLAWSPDNTRLMVASQFSLFQIWNVNPQGGPSSPINIPEIRAAAWSPNNQLLAVVDAHNNFYICNAQSGSTDFASNVTWSARNAPLSVNNALAWSPDSSKLAIDAISPPRDPLSGTFSNQSVDFVFSPIQSATTLAWSRDGHIAALGVDGTLQVWDSQLKSVFSQQISSQQGQLAWSPDSRFLAAIDDTNSLLILDKSNGNTLTSAIITDNSGSGSSFSGQALVWQSDNQHIAIANNNMECWLWKIPWF